jgi:hypothetical protein
MTDTARLAPATDERIFPFAVGDRVTCRDNWGPLCSALRVRAEKNPGEQFTVHEVRGGRWMSLRADDGRLYCHDSVFGASIGPTYFRIAGPCGTHYPAYSSARGGWVCARCDEPTGPREGAR